MDTRVLLLAVIVSSCWCSYARDLAANHFAGESALISDLRLLGDTQHMEESSKKKDLCTLCEKLASDVIKYLVENKTQAEIISILHQACRKLHPFKKQCVVLVDLYAPLLLSEVSSIKPKDLCRKVDICEKNVSVPQNVSKDKCDLCHTDTEALEKLKDPDTELEIVKLLMKACGSTRENVKKCKSLVIQYTPIILVNAQQLLETKHLCTISHACNSARGIYTS